MEQELDGQNLWHLYDPIIAIWGQKHSRSFGRFYTEVLDPWRLPFQRDKDRIIHSTAFRRLKGKTQVVAPNFGDHYRTRLTHTFEVAQLSRDIARELQLNEDLAEVIALTHDLGHPPYGHNGEEALNRIMKRYGKSFEHNQLNTFLIEHFEQQYEDFPGLNLTWETRMGIQKHRTGFKRPDRITVKWPSLESQVVDLADEISYLAADLEDGLRAGFIDFEPLKNLDLMKRIIGLDVFIEQKNRSKVSRFLIKTILRHLVPKTRVRLQAFAAGDHTDYLNSADPLVRFDSDFNGAFMQLKSFMFQYYYYAPKIKERTQAGEKRIEMLFEHYLLLPQDIPVSFFPDHPIEERVCYYIAGMTDSYLEEQI